MFGKDFDTEAMDYITMGRRIKEIRTKKGVTQEKLAEITGLSSAHISNIETAHTKVSLTALVSIANALKISLDEIVCDSLENSTEIYTNSLAQKLDDCNIVETRIISETIDALKKSLKNNKI